MPSQTTKESVVSVFTSTYAGLKNIANYAYGIGAASYSAHFHFAELWADYGIANTVAHTMSPVGMIISGIGALDALISIRLNFQNGCGVNDSRNAVNVLKLVASGTLFTAAYTHSSEFIAFSAASTTLSYLSGGMALVALTKLISDIQRFQAAGQAYDEMDDYSKGNRNFYGAIYKKARSDLMLSIMNTIGWTSLFLSHIPALAAAAPVLMVMGAVFLIAGGTYASYTACRNMEADISVVDTTKSQGRTGLFALPYRQHHLDQQLDIIMTQKRRL